MRLKQIIAKLSSLSSKTLAASIKHRARSRRRISDCASRARHRVLAPLFLSVSSVVEGVISGRMPKVTDE